MKFLNLSTERFQLNVMKPELVSDVYLNWLKDDQTNKFIINKKFTLPELKTYCNNKLNSDSCIFWGIFYNSLHIGNIKYEPINFKEKNAVMGVLIGDKHWQGKGVFKEIFHKTSQELFKIGINKIFLGVDSQNLKAIKSYTNIGFKILETKQSVHTMVFQF
jgi:RimJ/RimL family protein N-acetyltransferase